MATINGIQIWVKTESYNESVESSNHPVEKGIDVTDHVKPNPKTLSISGEIVGTAAEEKKARLIALMNKGALVTYVGRNTLANAQIQSISPSYSNSIWGGFAFDMQIKQVKIAKPAYQSNSVTASRKSTGTQQKQINTAGKTPIYHTVKKGDSRWSMAQKYGTSIDFITKNNNVKSITTNGTWYGLKVGAKVIVGYR